MPVKFVQLAIEQHEPFNPHSPSFHPACAHVWALDSDGQVWTYDFETGRWLKNEMPDEDDIAVKLV